MQTDELIEILVRDAAPIRRLAPPWRRTAVWLALSLAYVSLLVLVSPSLPRITAIRAPRFWLEQAAALTTGIAAATFALISVVPGGSRRARLLPLAPLTAWIGTMAWGVLRDSATRGSAALFVHSDWPCVAAMLMGALLPAITLAVMLRRGALLTPGATAGSAGFAVAAMGSVTACLSRPAPHGTTMTVLVWHIGTALVLASAAAWSGRYVGEWRLTPSTVSAVGRVR
jgi:hypothetical protein